MRGGKEGKHIWKKDKEVKKEQVMTDLESGDEERRGWKKSREEERCVLWRTKMLEKVLEKGRMERGGIGKRLKKGEGGEEVRRRYEEEGVGG